MTAGKVELTPGVLCTIPSGSTPGKTHEIRLSKEGTIYCDCEGFLWRGICSHIKQAMQANPSLRCLVRYSLVERMRATDRALVEFDE